ncbi:sulfite exporter TauE/SafE family protein [Candidatus Magnetobacterium casense]|uniref:Probable membrane transporter protein n=1 Tax=Candidatus Magnetobacterium casense TaxID=1455061 RepID=A0ABS6RZV7_9BACT|nr:sulfite exporter TauE/SafE family protein [Candidatus Magnetobacterium casensis]MBV6341860.1 sulfite exporter TauE/SafE family protein [Candidatus Magnetobacterium casensis]
MGIGRRIFEVLKSASIAHAKWDYEVSMSIVKNKKRVWLLLAGIIPILAVAFVEAGDFIGAKTAYGPAFYSTKIFVVSIAIGMAAGLITGCIGAGGGFIITPALMAAGVKGILAVGTDLFHIFAKAIMGTTIHKKLGNVSVKLAVAFLVGSTFGALIGGYINKTLYDFNPLLSEAFISLIYAVLLGFLGVYALIDFLKTRNAPDTGDVHGGGSEAPGITFKVQNIHLPPMIKFDEDYVPGGRSISGVIVALGGVIVGVMAAIMGVGGGFITFPMFVYIFGVSSMTTVGTDILQIIFTAGFAAITQYAIYGYVFYTLAMGMLLGSLIGIQVGALTTTVVKSAHIRGFYAVSILAGFINRVTTLPKKFTELDVINVPKSVSSFIESTGNIVFWAVVGFFAVWIFAKFFGNLKKFAGEA